MTTMSKLAVVRIREFRVKERSRGEGASVFVGRNKSQRDAVTARDAKTKMTG